MFEYMSLAKPTIASDLEQLSELLYPALKLQDLDGDYVSNDKVGLLVPPDDVEGFIQAACSLVAMKKVEQIAIGANARRKAELLYSWHEHTGRILKFVTRR